MALDDAALKEAILAILDGTIDLVDPDNPTSLELTGEAWGDAIDAYAATGGVINPGPAELPVTNLDPVALKAALEGAFAAGTPSGVASAMSTAIDDYWLPGVVAGATPGMLSTGGSALTSTLTTIFSFVGGTHVTKSAEIQAAITAHTALVVAVFVGPSPPAGSYPVV